MAVNEMFFHFSIQVLLSLMVEAINILSMQTNQPSCLSRKSFMI